jgi:endonuclease G
MPNRLSIAVLLLLILLTGCVSSIDTSDNIHLTFGNPSRANASDLDNYLIERSQYVLSYNCHAGIPNWVSWQLNSSWLGNVDRLNDFRPDPQLPESCYRVLPTDYRGSGFDRGHLIPSGDRTSRKLDNSSTFLMSNMIPQSPANNREVWQELEQYCRELAHQGKELYIVAGGQGKKTTIAEGKIRVPEYTWKVILVLEPSLEVTPNTPTFAVWMPNSEAVANTDWRDYLVSIDEVEKQTGYNFFSTIPKKIQKSIEIKY